MSIWLVGAGPMAQQYAKVLDAMHCDYQVIGRSHRSASEFTAATGKTVLPGGVDAVLQRSVLTPSKAIVAVGAKELFSVASKLIMGGVKELLLEKPGCLYRNEFKQLTDLALEAECKVFVAYNRRYFTSVIKARDLIEQEGGVSSFNFEFTEWSHLYLQSDKDKDILARALIGNSSHAIDLAFFLGGKPKELCSFRAGYLPWHEAGARFSGAGITEANATFSYCADWQAAGRWSVEVLTAQYRYILKPMETLHRIKTGSTTMESVVLDDEIDKRFKPGLFRQTAAFIHGDISSLCGLTEQLIMFDLYYKMAGYKDDKIADKPNV
ncbi:myo-inositol 2-dehydrogenase [Rheinheimera sp. SA_1]|uniref:Gfo/Idh/MocA family oxidoreductase n=1 Tax=Rheinheimera sp. SA_1 TaxID=1827365 RepID=UPI0007FC2D4A|nr:Gfo/Idh/MocA family oxidoreductase [Rheinheimera sp. SA_1]OBP15396.1 myo-inositol 2-dehydrogenase [Rheinheimera sp. SA_1]